jgi:cytochrome c-type biogenesis protein CcmH
MPMRRVARGGHTGRDYTALRIAVLVLLLGGAAWAAEVPTFQEVEEGLTCQCGCGLTVHSCNHLQCPSALPLRQEIREQLAKGLDKTSVLAHFEQKYGEKILSAPTTRGFNLTAWTVPFIGLGLGAALVIFTLLRWRRGGHRVAAAIAPGAGPAAVRNPHERTLERELEEFDR